MVLPFAPSSVICSANATFPLWGEGRARRVAAQAGFSWPFGPIHLLAPHADGALSVGADLRVRPPVLGAHIGAPLRRRAGAFFVIARRAAGPTRQSVFPRDKADSHGPFGASE